jgi:hypothetical protein
VDESDPERRYRRILEVYFLVLKGEVKTEIDYLQAYGRKLFSESKAGVRNQPGRHRHDLTSIAIELGLDAERAKKIYLHIYNIHFRMDRDRSPLGVHKWRYRKAA